MTPVTAAFKYLALVAVLALAAPPADAGTEITEHMRHLLNGADQWRAPNPQYDPQQGGPAEFGLRFELAPDGAHVTGDLTGLQPDGSEVVYWSLLALYNPVTERVVTHQIGWDGTLVYGEVPLQTGATQIVDMISYGVDGTMRMTRHESTFDDKHEHASVVYARDAGGWSKTGEWVWRREPLTGQRSLSAASPAPRVSPLDKHAGFLLAGSGRWRAPNPAFEPGSGDEQFYGMNYRWGPNRQHVTGEIVSIYEDGRQAREWSLYMTHNPVTGKSHLQQTGANGVYFRGELGELQDGRREHAGLIYLPNGTIKSVRDEIEIVDDKTYVAHVFERDDAGGWKKIRQWTWTLQAGHGE